MTTGELGGGLEAEPSILETLQADVANWAEQQAARLRAAGDRATWAGRRDIRGRSFAKRGPADGETDFRGRYAGKCKLPDGLIEVEYGGIDII